MKMMEVARMARAPYNIHVFLYRITADGDKEYAVFRRSDDAKWQGICGGGEDGETIIETALREAYEEAGIPLYTTLYKLDSISYIPATVFKASGYWGKNVVVVPMYYFCASYDGYITLSSEHSEHKWCNFNEASKLIYWHDQKNALWELNERLERGILIR
jgi:dihydroneopterin triphosphate diphosphatase